MGQVYRADDIRLDRVVALKFLRADLTTDPSMRARFIHEARSAARLNHPSAVTVFDSGEWNTTPYLVMECLPGATLADELARGPLAEPTVRALALDIAGALQAAHELGIVHRDVKPGNILMSAEGKAKLGDFGIAWSANRVDQTQIGLVIGTPAYLAPERLEGAPATAQSDLYSLAVVLYQALTGARPFDGDTPVALVQSIRCGPARSVAERRPGTNPALAAAIDSALARSPGDRPATARLFAAQVEGQHVGGGEETLPMALPATAVWSHRAPPPESPTPSALPVTAPQDQTPSADRLAPALPRDGGRGGSTSKWIVIAFILVALVLGATILAVALWSDDSTPPPAAPPATSTPLDEAINRLEASVQP